MSRRSLIERIDRVPGILFNGTVLRNVAPGYSALSGEGARIRGGRWNPPNSFPVLYTALDAGTAALEVNRTAKKMGVAAEALLPRNLMTLQVSLSLVLDLTDPNVLKSTAMTPAVLVDDDVRICQALGDAAHYIGFEGLLAPSAAGPGTTLVIFPNSLKQSSQIEVVRTELLEAGDVT